MQQVGHEIQAREVDLRDGFSFLIVQLGLFGLYMGASFAPNHVGMPLVSSKLKLDFLRKGLRGLLWSTGLQTFVVLIVMAGVFYLSRPLIPGISQHLR